MLVLLAERADTRNYTGERPREKDVRESQHFIVPSSRGNHPEGHRGGKEAPSHEPLEGNMLRFTGVVAGAVLRLVPTS